MTNKLFKRHVYYLSGFDPRGVRHYHQLYQKHAAEQSKVNGITFQVSNRQKENDEFYTWQIQSVGPEGSAETKYHFLRWDDLIRNHWAKNWVSILQNFLFCLRTYYATGIYLKLIRADKKAFYAGTYPFVYIFFVFTGIAAGISLIAYSLSLWLGAGGAAIGLVLGFLLSRWLLTKAWEFGERSGAFWLLRIYAFSRLWAQGDTPQVQERIQTAIPPLLNALIDEQVDEVLVVGHSVGSILAVSLVARALKALGPGANVDRCPHLTLLILGECIPLASFHPQARAFRNEMELLAKSACVTWLDYTSPTDGACFSLINPFTSTGIKPPFLADIRILSPRFFTLFTPERYAAMRRDWYLTHFLYLMSHDNAGEYDFFKLTAGARPARLQVAEASS